jgi:hypothetical protein
MTFAFSTKEKDKRKTAKTYGQYTEGMKGRKGGV